MPVHSSVAMTLALDVLNLTLWVETVAVDAEVIVIIKIIIIHIVINSAL